MRKSLIVDICSILFISLFLYTAISKLAEYSIFKQQIEESPVLANISSLIAAGLPAFELLVTFLLVIPRWRLKGLYGALLLMISFTIYIVSILMINERLPCSCGGLIAEMSWTQHLVFNTIFIGVALLGIIIERQIKKQRNDEWRTMPKVEFETL